MYTTSWNILRIYLLCNGLTAPWLEPSRAGVSRAVATLPMIPCNTHPITRGAPLNASHILHLTAIGASGMAMTVCGVVWVRLSPSPWISYLCHWAHRHLHSPDLCHLPPSPVSHKPVQQTPHLKAYSTTVHMSQSLELQMQGWLPRAPW